MDWIDFLWPTVTGVCLTLAAIHLRSGIVGASRKENLLCALVAFLMAVYSWTELHLIHADTSAEYLERLRWQALAAAAVVISLTAFVWSYFGSRRSWLAWLGIGVLCVSLVPNLAPIPGLVFLSDTGIEKITTVGGAVYPVAYGKHNPFSVVPYLGLALLMLFVADASIRYWRQVDRRSAALIGGSVFTLFLLAGIQSYLVDEGIIRTPYLLTLIWLIVLGTMAWELSNDQIHAHQLEKTLRQNQNRMNMAVNAANIGIWEWDIGKDEIWTNEVVRSRAGISESDTSGLSRFIQAVVPEDRDKVNSVLRSSADNGGDFSIEFRYEVNSGSTRWIALQGQVVNDRNGRPKLMRAVSQDVTGQKQNEAEAVELRQELAHYNRIMQMNELSAAIAHEINQPLGAILNNATTAQLLYSKHTHNDDEVGEILQCIIDDTNRASQIVRNVRTMAGHGEVALEILPVNFVIEEIVMFAQKSLQSNNISVVMDLAPDLPQVKANRIGLQQVLLNLINNAQEAMRQSSTKILKVTSRASISDGVTVGVTDSGIGIDELARDKMFRPFFTTKKEGVGMGLRICRSIIEDHNGRMWIESNPGAGTTACFSIPSYQGELI